MFRLKLIARFLFLALALVPTNAYSRANKSVIAPMQSRLLVTYKEERGGIKFRFTSLIVSTDRQAIVRFEGCLVRVHLNAVLWKRLKVALKQTNLHTLAGDYVPATPHADESTWVITVGRDRVRITDFSIPHELRVKLEPLLNILGEVLSVGKRDMPQSCSSNRVITSMG